MSAQRDLNPFSQTKTIQRGGRRMKRSSFWSIILCFSLSVSAGQATSAGNNWAEPSESINDPKVVTEVFTGCAHKAQTVYNIAFEKLYKEGNTQKLREYLEKTWSEAEFVLNWQVIEPLSLWVDKEIYETARVYTGEWFVMCLNQAYEEFKLEQDAMGLELYQQFFDSLNSLPREPFENPKSKT